MQKPSRMLVGLALAGSLLTGAAHAQQIDPSNIDRQGRPNYPAFAARYDGNSPALIKGVVVRVDMLTPYSTVWVYGAQSGGADQLWRIEGPAPPALDATSRATLLGSAGQGVTVRGYMAKDTSCSPTCRVNARDITRAEGGPLLPPVEKPDCTIQDLRAHACTTEGKVDADRPPPGQAEIAAALKAGKGQGAIIERSFITNSVKRQDQ